MNIHPSLPPPPYQENENTNELVDITQCPPSYHESMNPPNKDSRLEGGINWMDTPNIEDNEIKDVKNQNATTLNMPCPSNSDQPSPSPSTIPIKKELPPKWKSLLEDFRYYYCPYNQCFKIMRPIIFLSLCGIIFGIFFGVVYPTILDRKYYEETTCTSLNYTDTRGRCCTVDSCSCSECNYGTNPDCDVSQLVFQNLNRSTCCGEPQCCRQCCDTCSVVVCSKDSNGVTVCGTRSYSCNCKCCSSVNHKSCAFRCGTCSNVDAYYIVTATNITQHYYQSCGLDDWKCMNTLRAKYDYGMSWPCWYDLRNPYSVRFNGIPTYNVAALVFFGIFCFIMLIFIVTPWGKFIF